jgi:uncharacterized SAM-binding protein YcdF (DUF218 family)
MDLRIWKGAVLGLIIWAGAAVALDQRGLRSPPAGQWQAIAVAGCRVMPDGQPSVSLQRRTRRAVELWQGGAAPIIIFTGGVGTYPPSEAAAAAQFARDLGLPEAAIRLEDRSTSTEENARYAAADHPVERLLVVTDSYHTFRAARVFGRYFSQVEAVGVASQPWPRIKGSLREVLAVAGYAATGRL